MGSIDPNTYYDIQTLSAPSLGGQLAKKGHYHFGNRILLQLLALICCCAREIEYTGQEPRDGPLTMSASYQLGKFVSY